MKLKIISFLCGLYTLPNYAWATVDLENNNNPVSGKIVYAYITPLLEQLTQQATYTAGIGISIANNVISGAYTVSNGLNLNGANIQGYTSGTGVTVNTGTSPASLDVTLTGGNGITVNNATISQTTFLSVGDFYQGGVVFYVDATGQHGLITSLVNQSETALYFSGCSSTTIPCFAQNTNNTGIGAGEGNTTSIIAQQSVFNQQNGLTETNAAIIASQFVVNAATGNNNGECTVRTSGQVDTSVNCIGDWYLPSQYELGLLLAVKDSGTPSVNQTITANGGVTIINNQKYLSSTEQNATSAYNVQLNTQGSTVDEDVKNDNTDPAWTRAIRRF